MKYFKAQNVLPQEIVKIVQEYIDGGYIYIPRKNDTHKAWGEESGARASLKKRNSEIYKSYIKGTTIMQLSKQYYLSEQSIRRIISQEKLLCSTS